MQSRNLLFCHFTTILTFCIAGLLIPTSKQTKRSLQASEFIYQGSQPKKILVFWWKIYFGKGFS